MRSVLTILAGACCATLAVAQPPVRTTTTTVEHHRITTVVGTTFTLGTENMGKVVDVVFNDGGCIDYCLVQDSEGFIVVPWNVVTVNYEQKTVVVQSTAVTAEKLREMRFAEGRLPNFTDPSFTQKVTTVWGTGAGRSGASPGRTGDRPGTTNPDRKDRTSPPDPKGTAPPAKDRPGTTPPRGKEEPPAKDIPKTEPKKDPKKDKDGK
jgi:PRC-barrel domain